MCWWNEQFCRYCLQCQAAAWRTGAEFFNCPFIWLGRCTYVFPHQATDQPSCVCIRVTSDTQSPLALQSGNSSTVILVFIHSFTYLFLLLFCRIPTSWLVGGHPVSDLKSHQHQTLTQQFMKHVLDWIPGTSLQLPVTACRGPDCNWCQIVNRLLFIFQWISLACTQPATFFHEFFSFMLNA